MFLMTVNKIWLCKFLILHILAIKNVGCDYTIKQLTYNVSMISANHRIFQCLSNLKSLLINILVIIFKVFFQQHCQIVNREPQDWNIAKFSIVFL